MCNVLLTCARECVVVQNFDDMKYSVINFPVKDAALPLVMCSWLQRLMERYFPACHGHRSDAPERLQQVADTVRTEAPGDYDLVTEIVSTLQVGWKSCSIHSAGPECLIHRRLLPQSSHTACVTLSDRVRIAVVVSRAYSLEPLHDPWLFNFFEDPPSVA
jgi:hypothetical protein